MANVKISQLPQYTGDTSGSWFIMNNSGETTTYKVVKENLVPPGAALFAKTGSVWNTTNNVGITGSFYVSGTTNTNGKVAITGSIQVDGNYAGTGSFSNNGNAVYTGSIQVDGNYSGTGSYNQNGNAAFTGSLSVSGNTSITGSFKVSGTTNLNGNTAITGSVNINGNTSITGSISSSLGGNFNTINVNAGYNSDENLFVGVRVATSSLYSSNSVLIGYDIFPNVLNVSSSVMIGNNIGGTGSDPMSNTNYNNILIGNNIATNASISGTTNFDNNIAIGYNTLNKANLCEGNIAIGSSAMGNGNGNSQFNISLGQNSLLNIDEGNHNIAMGYASNEQLLTGSYNVSVGFNALNDLKTGSGNVAIGPFAGDKIISTGSNFLFINNEAQSSFPGYWDRIQSQSLVFGRFSNNVAGALLRFNAPVQMSSSLFVEGPISGSSLNISGSAIISGNSTNSGLLKSEGGASLSGSIYFANLSQTGNPTRVLVQDTSTGRLHYSLSAGSSGTSGTSGLAGSSGTSGTSGTSPVVANFITTGSISQTQAITGSLRVSGSFRVTGTTTLSGSLLVQGSEAQVQNNLKVAKVLNLVSQDLGLPIGTVGDLGVSGSHLYFHNGTAWIQVI